MSQYHTETLKLIIGGDMGAKLMLTTYHLEASQKFHQGVFITGSVYVYTFKKSFAYL